MNYYILKLKDKEGKEQEIKLRLRSIDCIEIEKKTGKNMIEVAQDYSITSITMLLKYMRRGELPQFSNEDAYELFDLIVDNGYSLEDIITDIIYEGLVASGFFKKEDLEELKTTFNKTKNPRK